MYKPKYIVCKDCQERYPACHDKCEKYQAERAENLQEKEKYYKEAILDIMADDYEIKKCMKKIQVNYKHKYKKGFKK